MARTLLLADDSSTIRRIVELTFAESEFRVESFADGESLMERIRQDSADVVLVDLIMPGVSGYELCRQIKALQDVPVLLLAGAFEPLDEQLAADCGADGSMVKPFEAELLRTKVADALERPTATAPEFEDLPAEWVERVVDLVIERLAREDVRDVVRDATREAIRELAPELIRERIQELEDDA
jgi:DNA-binding response OmpR family regulator